jgi:hypothetical protein
LLLDRAPRRWYVPVTAGIVLTWVIIADRVALLTAVVPLVLVCGARVLWAVLRHRKSLASQWYELSLVAASVLSFVVAELVVRLISYLGGYHVTPVMSATLAPLHTLPRRVVVAFEGILNIYGADFFHISQNSPFGPALGGLPVGVGVALAAVHLVGVALAVWGFFRAFRYFFDPRDLVSPVLATAIAVNVGAYSVSIVAFGLFDTREILAALPFGAVLAGRMVPAQLARGATAAEAGACVRLSGRAGLLRSRAWLRRRPAPGAGQHAGGHSLAGGASPHPRAGHLRRVEPHHDGQRGPRRDQGCSVALRR